MRIGRRILQGTVLTLFAGAALLFADEQRAKRLERERRSSMSPMLGPGEYEGERVYDEDGTVLAWRAWGLEIQLAHDIVAGVLSVPDDVYLRGVGFHYRWQRGVNEAMCQASSMSAMGWGLVAPPRNYTAADDSEKRHPGDRAPATTCQCGYWALNGLEAAANRLANYRFCVFGVVRMWGRVQHHDEGVRAQFAMPEVLFIHPGLAPVRDLLATKYECPVYFFTTPESLYVDEPAMARLLDVEDDPGAPLSRLANRQQLAYAETSALQRMRGEIPEPPPHPFG